MELKNSHKVLIKNTIFMYILTFSSYFFGFLIIPFQTRVLGPELFGKLGFALALALYFRLVVDFGFILSATEEVSRNRDNFTRVAEVLTSVNIIKTGLFVVSTIVFYTVIQVLPLFTADWLFFFLVYISVILPSFIPDYIFRGLEKMEVVAYRTVFVNFISAFLTIVLLREQKDYYIIPIISIISNVIVIFIIYIYMDKKFKLSFCKVSFKKVKASFFKSLPFFISRIASSVYSGSNILVLGFIYSPQSSVVGLYSAADRLINVGKAAFSPISDSIYPYMIRHRDYKLLFKVLSVLVPVVVILVILIIAFSGILIPFILGSSFSNAITYFNILILIIMIIPAQYLLGFPALTPIGLSGYANLSVVIGSLIHFVGLLIFLVRFSDNPILISYLTVTTELVILVIRICILIGNRSKIFQERVVCDSGKIH